MPAKYNTGEQQSRIHLVTSTSAPHRDERRLRLGRYTADIVTSKREQNCCYYVIQRVGSADIVDMQRFNTPEDAEAAAFSALKCWNGEDLVRQLAS